MYSNCTTLIEQIKERLPILDAARRYLPGLELTRRGRSHWANCPFHGEKTASFSIIPDKGKAHCFGCGWSGDSIDLSLKAMGWTLKQLAADLGIVSTPSPADRRERQRKYREQRRISDLASSLQNQIESAVNQLSAILRSTYEATKLVSETDLDRPELAGAFALQSYLPYLIDELNSKEPARQHEALRAARGLLKCQ